MLLRLPSVVGLGVVVAAQGARARREQVTALAPQLLRRQPDPERDCAVYAALNLYEWAGLVAPQPEDVRAALETTGGPSLAGILGALVGARFPRTVGLAVVQADATAREVFPPLLDAGCALLVLFTYKSNAKTHSHILVAVDHAERGLLCLDSSDPAADGETYPVESEDSRPDAEALADYLATVPVCDFGARVYLPWVTPEFDAWHSFDWGSFRSGSEVDAPLGVGRAFLVACPPLS